SSSIRTPSRHIDAASLRDDVRTACMELMMPLPERAAPVGAVAASGMLLPALAEGSAATMLKGSVRTEVTASWGVAHAARTAAAQTVKGNASFLMVQSPIKDATTNSSNCRAP